MPQSSASSESSFMSASSEVVPISSEQTANSSVANDNNSQASSVPVVSLAEQLPEVVLNSEEWHRTFPSVRIISAKFCTSASVC